ncbi:MAG TPA: metallophosphoesterase [Saprospiraceae bacterium]|nr:metallophosphoesterase [Saprospiraceae bacterium]
MKLNFLPLLLAILPFSLFAGDPPLDLSKAGTDGPYIFYRGQHQKLIVKYIESQDTAVRVRTQHYDSRTQVKVSCQVSSTGDAFSFPLQDTLRVEPDVYPMPSKMLVLSDIEGNFEGFKMMLQGARAMDKDFRWTFGNGHLVLLGDFMDRGLNVTECLWLIYKLEHEAAAAGGKVHFILGNHEVLNLEGCTRYVRRKYIENTALLGEPYIRLYDEHTELGRWMRTKNAMERIGDHLFCHGGFSPELSTLQLGIHQINEISRDNLGIPYEKLQGKKTMAVFSQHTGVFWYRNGAKNLLSDEDMTKVLTAMHARRMVVGHTLQPDISALYQGKLICIDLYHEDNLRQGFMKALWIEGGLCFAIDSHGGKHSLYSVTEEK